MARLLADENFPLPVAERLRRLGHDVLTLRDLGRAGASLPDDRVLDTAAHDGRAVLTLNRRDFYRLHRAGRNHAGIIICTFDIEFDSQADQIDSLLRSTADLSRGLFRVNLPHR